jgi:BNR repeat-like domain
MRYYLLAITAIGLIITDCKDKGKQEVLTGSIVSKGQMPNAASDDAGRLHLVFGNGDSIMYSSLIYHGKLFSNPVLVSILPELNASHMRGPQIAATSNGLTIIASNNKGDIFSYKKNNSGNWQLTGKVNDVDTVAKEGLMALKGDGDLLYAVWLDLRDKHNKIFGARSMDGGQHWSKNIMVYASPDSTICECCKPSVVVKDNAVFVMFRNWLNGNRDLYLIRSNDGGLTYDNAEKLGNGSWALNGCPMDGGGLAVSDNKVQTVWNRQGKIYACEPGKQEKEIGEGRDCTLETIDGKNVYAWTEKGMVVCLLPQIKKSLGKGKSPVLKSTSKGSVMCIWENENEIHSILLTL